MSTRTPDHIWVDCYGRSYQSEFHVEAGGTLFSFVFDPDLKKGRRFSLALYLDHAICGQDLRRYPKEKRIALLLESPITLDKLEHRADLEKQFIRIYTHRRKRYERGLPWKPLYYGTSWLGDDWRRRFDKSSLFSFVGSVEHPDHGGYSLRRQVAEICLSRTDVECFGKGVNPIVNKMEGLDRFAFSIAMENTREDYYFSEKLVDCFLSECVPLYWGCPGIGDLFDRRGIIEFETANDLQNILDNLTFADYACMHPFVLANKRRIIELLCNDNMGIYMRLSRSILADSLLITQVGRPGGIFQNILQGLLARLAC